MSEVKAGQFVIVQDGSYGQYGVKKNDVVYLAGDTLVRYNEDPYAFRKIFLAAFVKDGHIDVEAKPFTIDGKRLKAVSVGKQAKLDAIRNADFEEAQPSNV